jgi:alpha,alpha-trehalase
VANYNSLEHHDPIQSFKPTSKGSAQVLADFTNLTVPVTIGKITDFINSDFRGEGLELDSLSTPNIGQDPAFLNNVSDSIVKAWSKTVHGYWTKLIRSTNYSEICGKESQSSCESSLIPLNHTFVVPGEAFFVAYALL